MDRRITSGHPGTQRTLFPRVKMRNGGWFAILASTVIANNATTFSLPGADSLTTYESGSALGLGNESANATAYGKVSYWTQWGTAITAANFSTTSRISNISVGGV